MKKFFVTLGVILMTKLAYCVENHWQVNPYAFEFNMNVTAAAYIDDVEQQNEMLEIGVFFGEELRGSALPRLSPLVNKYIYDLTIYSDETCELSFKLYDHSTNEVSDLDCEQILTFVANGTEGNAFNPYIIAFSTPIPAVTFTGNGSWNDASNWENSTLPTETDAVVIDGNVLVSDEVTVNSLSINEGKSVTIQDGGMLIVTGEIVNTDYDALIIEDGGQIIQRNENVAATFKKNIVNPSSWSNPESGWQFISSPMMDAASEGFESIEGDYDLYKFDGSQELQWVNYKNHEDFEETFTPGVGYIASYQSQDVAVFKGDLNNETEYFEFEIGFDADNEWACFSLLGNPFSFDIDWELMVPSRLEDGFVTLNSTTGAYIYNVEGKIKVGEGFMVNAYNRRSSLEYDNSAKSRKEKSDYINIVASNSNGFDNVIINDVKNESAGFPKLDNINPNIANVYVKHEDRRYGIFNRGESEEIPLYFDAKEMGTYTLTFDVKGDYENLYLLDKMTGEKINLLLENEYEFMANSNDDTERFIIKMDNSQQTTDNSHFAYVSGEELIINAEGTIQIIDMMGRMIYSNNVESSNNRINVSDFNRATYVVRVINENGVKVQK
ncbi:MAG: T9SS type A sorting domain-containing protein, partial [Bacteroidales bacterium]|nr:T9SS type A sorting domain-containing protein [Bacteroidales bacterium]